MTDKTEKKAVSPTGSDGNRSLGNQADPSVKASRPQVSDKAKIGGAASSISDLSDRLARLNDASGPFGSTDVDFASGRVDALLEDDPADEPAAEVLPEVMETPDVPEVDLTSLEDDASPFDEELLDVSGDAEEEPMSLDDILGNSVEDEDTIEVTPISQIEVTAAEDEEYNNSVDDFLIEMSEDGLFEIDEDPNDPVDDIVEAALEAKSAEPEKSPFAALFSSVDEEDDIFDAGLPDMEEDDIDDEEPESVSVDDDEGLFFNDIDFAAADVKPGPGKSLLGASFLNEDQDDTTEEEAADTTEVDSDLPTLTMGGDNDLYAPGTDYADDDLTHTSEEDEFEDNVKDDDASKIFEQHIEKDDTMGTPKSGSEGADDHAVSLDDLDETSSDVNTFNADDLDDLLDEDENQGLAGDLEGVDNTFPEDPDAPERDIEDDAQVDNIFGDDDDEEEVVAAVVIPVDDTVSEEVAAVVIPVVAPHVPVDDTQTGALDDLLDEADVAEVPAKKSRMKVLMLSAAVFAIAGVGVGYAAFTGVLGGGYVAPVVVAEPLDFDPKPSVIALNPGPLEPIQDISITEAEPEPGTIKLADLISTAKERNEDVIIDGDLAAMMDPSEAKDLSVEEPSVLDLDIDRMVGGEPVIVDPIEPMENDFDKPAFQIPSPVEVTSIDEDTPTDVDTIMPVDLPDAVVEDDIANLEDPLVVLDPIEPVDPIIALANQIRQSGEDKVAAAAAEDNDAALEDTSGSIFVEEGRVMKIEDDVTTIALRLDDLTGEVSKMSGLIMQSIERNSLISSRVESNERSLLGVSAILAEFIKVQESLDQTQIVLLDIAARVGSLETNNPADRDEVAEALEEINGEMVRLTANMAILARMTVNGSTAARAPAASATTSGVQTTQSSLPRAGKDTVYDDGNQAAEGTTPPASTVPSDASKGDFIEGYGYVLDVVPASGNQNLVVMENGSVLVQK
jgi:hypothetical protein